MILIVARSINNGLSRLINFVCTFGGLFDSKFIGILVMFISTIGVSALFINRIRTPSTVVETPSPTIMTIEILNPNSNTNQNLPNVESQPNPQVSYPPEASLLRTSLIKALKWLNLWLEKQINKLSK